MAINFLDNIQLNQNQLLGARIENVTSDPSSANGGDIIFNSTSKILKYYDGTSPFNASGWISLTSSGSVATEDVLGSIKLASDTTQSVAANAVSSTASRTYGVQLNDDDQAVVNVPWVDTNTGMVSFTLTGDSGTNQTIENGNTLDVAGGTNISTVVGTTDTVTVNLDDNVTLAGDLTVTGGDITLGGTGRIQGVDTVTDGTDAASKSYVDSAVAGGLNVKGGFNANTGAIVSGGNLTSGGSRVAIAVGDYYVVTVAGNFFGNAATPLTPGDSVLVQTAAAAGASVEGDFAVIQSDTDLATTTSPGIASFPAAEFGVTAGAVSLVNSGVTANTYGSTTTVPRFAVNAKGIVTAVNNETIAIPHTQITDFDAEVDALVEAREFSSTSSSGTSHVFTHNLATDDVIVQIFDASTKETVYASVDRTSTNVVTVTTAASANIRCLITKIG